jgi:ABC-type transport system involved in cytochrome c biogenesis permease subunit
VPYLRAGNAALEANAAVLASLRRARRGPPIVARAGPMIDFDVPYALGALFYAGYLVSEWVAPSWRNPLLGAGIAAHVAGLVIRGHAISYFPLTNKFESFYAFAFAAFTVCLLSARSPSRVHRVGIALVGAAFYAATLAFDRAPTFPPPLMITVFYPLHVPASFFAYALWVSAAADGVAVLSSRRRGAQPGRALENHAFWGWCAFSLSMIFGGAWGYVAWGAYFMWDPKVVWSVVLWLFWSGFVHIRHWPEANTPRVKASLALGGVGVMLVAYVGTSFLFQHSSHSFR